jgi:hypothetical protein
MLLVPHIAGPPSLPDPKSKKRGPQLIHHQNWVSVKHVRASFDIRHDGPNLFLDFFVLENQVRAVNTEYNSPVWEDSCVEFFFSLKGDEDHYYNFEFNAIGTILGAYGPDRHERNWLPSTILTKIETFPSLGRTPIEQIDGQISWILRVKIPAEVLTFNQIENFTGLDGYANFYKCGDLLKEPHYLSWNPVLTDHPDFHTPRYFRHISFL